MIDLDHHYFGREDSLEILKKRLTSLKDGYRQNVAILGSRYIGKSSILKSFINNLDDDDVVVVYLDLEEKDPAYLFQKFIGALLYNYAKILRLPTQDDLDVLIKTLQPHIPHTIQVINKIRNDFKLKKISASYLGLLTLPEIFTNETNKFCFLVFDEFQYLEKLGLPHVFQDLGKKIMTQKKCLYVITSSYPQLAKKIVSEKLSLLFGHFEVLTVEPLSVKSCQRFIESSLAERKMGAQLCGFLTDFTGGHPLYLNLIVREMRNLSAIYNQNEVYMPLVTQAIENTLFDRWGVISRHFELLMQGLCGGKSGEATATMLLEIANGRHHIDDIVKTSEISKVKARQVANMLLEEGVVIRNGKFHYFKDKLLKYWLKYVYQKRIKMVDLSFDRQRREFKEELNRLVEDFKSSARKDFSSRIIELLHCFENESLQLNGRQYQLPSFKEVVPFKLRNDTGSYFDVIKAFSGEDAWFVVLKKDAFAETDVSMVLEESKKIGLKPKRCVIVSLSDLDQNARLKALQEKFWIWNESEINMLLSLFDKPSIAR